MPSLPTPTHSEAKSTEFSREPSYQYVARNIADNLLPALGDDWRAVSDNLWSALEKEIQPEECEIYSYSGDAMSDPFSEEGALWSFAYFFFNKKLKRILFFTCCAFR